MKVTLLEEGDKDELLNDSSKNDKSHSEPRKNAYFLFKLYMVGSMVFFWTGYTILVRYTRTTVPASEMYASSTLILLTEILKLVVTVFFIFKDAHFSFQKLSAILNDEFISKPWELLRMSVPSICYALQNNLDFISLSNLDAGVYQVMIQLKIVSTAVFMMIILRRTFSKRRWLAIFLLFVGIAFVQLSTMGNVTTIKSANLVEANTVVTKLPSVAVDQNPVVGMIAVLATCATAGFAGVYFEMMLKDGSTTPFWIRNLQMYTCGLVSTFIGCAIYDRQIIQNRGFFYGYNSYVWLIIVFLGFGGIFISLIMKYMDNLYKSFASSISIIFVVLVSIFLFNDTKLNLSFMVGTSTVCVALILYNSVND